MSFSTGFYGDCFLLVVHTQTHVRAVGAGAAGAVAAGPKLHAQNFLNKNNFTKISAYASFLGNNSVARPTSTCTIDMAQAGFMAHLTTPS